MTADCTHSINSSSAQAGFFIIVQSELSIGQLLVNETRQDAPGGPVVVQLIESGNHHVTIFPKNVESGLVNSVLAYSIELSVLVGTPTANPTGLLQL